MHLSNLQKHVGETSLAWKRYSNTQEPGKKKSKLKQYSNTLKPLLNMPYILFVLEEMCLAAVSF